MTNQPIISPVLPPPGVAAPAPPPARRFVKFGGYMICPTCRYTEEWCGCGKVKTPSPPTPDGAESSIELRIRQLRQQQGGR
jgi:hypothetical protein